MALTPEPALRCLHMDLKREKGLRPFPFGYAGWGLMRNQ